MIKRFKQGAMYLIGMPKLSDSQNRNEPTFDDKNVVTVSGGILKKFGVVSVADLATKPIQPALKRNKMYWVYEIQDDANLEYFGEFTPIVVLPTQPMPIVQARFESEQGQAMTTLGDAMQTAPQSSYNEWRTKYEAAQDQISTLQDSLESLRDERESENDRITSLVSTQAEEQSKIVRAQLEASNSQVEKLYKTISERDRQIFTLQQEVLDLQMKLHTQKVKSDYQRDFDRAAREIERKAVASAASNGNGLGDLIQLAIQALPLLLADKGSKDGSLSGAPPPSRSDTRSRKRTVEPQIVNGYANNLPSEVTNLGAVEQPVRESGPYIPPRASQMPPPRRVLLAEEQNAEVVDTTLAERAAQNESSNNNTHNSHQFES